MTQSPDDFKIDELTVDLAGDADHAALQGLFRASMVEGHLRTNDTGADIENLKEAYFADDGASAFWVARYRTQVIGMIGVQKTAENMAEIRRLRVHDDFRRMGVGTRLMQSAMAFCRKHGYLKVALDVRVERGPAIALFEKFGFTHARTRDIDGHKLLDFYLDLYRDTQPGS